MLLSRILLGALALALVLSVVFSGRGWHAANVPRVDPVAELSDTPGLEQVRRYTEIGSAVLPYPPGVRAPDQRLEDAPLRLGWSYREVSLAGMPFWGRTELGWVTYLETAEGIQVAMLTPGRVTLLERMTGDRFSERYSFPFYRHYWGWLWVLGLLAWTFLHLRASRRRREAHWAQADGGSEAAVPG